MFRKLLVVSFVVMFLAGLALAQRGHDKNVQGEFFGTEAFLRPLKIVAGTNAPELTLSRSPADDCLPEQVDVSCFLITDPNVVTTRTLTDVTRIVIPGKTLRDVLLIEGRNFTTVWYNGDLFGDASSLFLYNPTISIESPALPQPITANVGHKRNAHTVHPGEFGNEDLQYSRMVRLTRSLLKEGFGFSDDVVNKFFDNDITIRLGITMRVRQVDFADGFYDLMIFGY